MRLASTLAILLFFYCSTCYSQATSVTVAKKTAPDAQLSENGKISQAINTALNRPIDVHFDEFPWSKVEEFFEKTLDVNFVLTSSASDDSLSADEPIICHLQGMSVRSTLRIMLQQKNATFLVQDGVVKIISLDDAEDAKYFTNHFINVRPLLANISKFESNRLRTTQQPHSGGKMGGGPSSSPVKPAAAKTSESMLIDLIQASVYPDQWRDTGQGLATITIIGGYVVVSCQDSLADSLKDFLQDLNFNLSKD